MAKSSPSYAFNRLLVALDTTELDQPLLATAKHLSEKLSVEKIYFLHIAKKLELPEELREKYPDLAPADETVEHAIRSEVKQVFGEASDIDLEVEGIEGDPVDKLLRYVKTKKIDLLLLGRKTNLSGSGTIPNKLVKVAPCSVLFVPENGGKPFNRILVPMDFSDHAKSALEQALSLAEGQENGELICHSVVSVPSGYHTSGKSREEFGIIMQGHAEKEYAHFMQSVDCGNVTVRSVFETNDDNNPADEIYDRAVAEKVDLIVLGSKGRKGLSSVLLGSVASKVLDFAKEMPVMVVKDKGEGLNLLQALLRL